MTDQIDIQHLSHPLHLTFQHSKPTPYPSVIDEYAWVLVIERLEDLGGRFADGGEGGYIGFDVEGDDCRA
jgi:hypothetical protein